MVRNKVRKKENRKQIDLAKSLSSTSRSTQGWEPTGFQAKVDWISGLTGPEKDWKRSVTLQTSLYSRSLALIEDLYDQLEEREANRREKPASKSGQVEVSCRLLVRPLCPNLRPFFLVWWRLWRPNFFQGRLSTTIAQSKHDSHHGNPVPRYAKNHVHDSDRAMAELMRHHCHVAGSSQKWNGDQFWLRTCRGEEELSFGGSHVGAACS